MGGEYTRREEPTLVRSAQQGNADAFGRLAQAHRTRIYAIVYAKLLNHADAEEVTQDTLLRAYERLGDLRAADKLGAWLARVALSRVAVHLRRRGREEPAENPRAFGADERLPTDIERFEQREDASRLAHRALRLLPPSLRAPLVLRYMAGCSHREIGEILVIRPAAAERRVQRARDRLREHFARTGARRDAPDSVLSLLFVAPAGLGPSADIYRSLAPKPARATTTGMAPLAALGTGAALALWVGVGLTHWAWLKDVRGAMAPAPTQRAHVARLRSPSMTVDSAPVGAVLLFDQDATPSPSGTPLPGWTAGISSDAGTTGPYGHGGCAIVTTNIPAAYYRFPLTHGILTVEMWLKPYPGDAANCGVSIGHDGRMSGATDTPVLDTDVLTRTTPDSFMPVHKDDGDRWYVSAAGALGPEPVGLYTGDWTHVRARYDTVTQEYDLYIDRRVVRRGVKSPTNLPGGVSFVALNSGRWQRERDKPSYVSGMRIYMEPHEGRPI